MKSLEQLLENYWILKDKDKELYYSVKDSLIKYKVFLNDKLGYQTIVNPSLIKLEKLPGRAESWMGIKDFDSKIEYIFLCLLLIFLEDKEKEEQFILSSITEFIQGNYPGEEGIDWTKFSQRRSLIKTLRFATKMDIIRLTDGNEQSFANDEEVEVLYENTATSRYFARNFNNNILDYSTYLDFERDILEDMRMDRGVLRRQRVYRRLLMSPIVYNDGPDDSDYAYIKNFRSLLENDFDKFLNIRLDVHKNGACLVLPESHTFKDIFPNNRAISDIVLQFNYIIRENIINNLMNLDKDDSISLSRVRFETIIRELKDKNSMGWSKEYREMTLENLVEDILNYMEDFNFIRRSHKDKEIKIMPLVGKITGSYDDNILKKMNEDGGENK